MAHPERSVEIAKACGSSMLERKLDLYLEKSSTNDKDLEIDIRKVCMKLSDSIIEMDAFIKEISVMTDSAAAMETATFLRNRLYKDLHTMTDMMVARREAEVSQREKDIFAAKLKEPCV